MLSQTGTGKTHAYLFYLLNHLRLEDDHVQAIIITPTRELALQVFQVASRIKDVADFKIELLIGGTDRNRILKKLTKQPQLIIGTPGRINDLFTQESAIRCDLADFLILDEADTIFEYGFIEDVDHVAAKMKTGSNILLFSATLPLEIRPFIKKYLSNPHLIEVAEDPLFKPQIQHVLINRKHLSDTDAVLDLLACIHPLMCLIFVNTRTDAAALNKALHDYGIDSIELHGDLSARERKRSLLRIQRNEVQFIVATDIAARGIDLPEISHVINCSLPNYAHLSFYVHRAGRTGRTGQTGVSYTFVSADDKRSIEALEKQGIHFEFMRIKNKQLVETSSFFAPAKRVRKTNPEILKKVNTKKSNVVKPGYKKKKQAVIEKIERKKKREMIQKSINEQKKIRAKSKQISKSSLDNE